MLHSMWCLYFFHMTCNVHTVNVITQFVTSNIAIQSTIINHMNSPLGPHMAIKWL